MAARLTKPWMVLNLLVERGNHVYHPMNVKHLGALVSIKDICWLFLFWGVLRL